MKNHKGPSPERPRLSEGAPGGDMCFRAGKKLIEGHDDHTCHVVAASVFTSRGNRLGPDVAHLETPLGRNASIRE